LETLNLSRLLKNLFDLSDWDYYDLCSWFGAYLFRH